jgi:type II secretory pathway component GspD/PulD (secretin)
VNAASDAVRTTWLAFVLALLTAGVPSPVSGESLEAIPLQHRLAEELVPILEPLLPPGAALTGTGDVLLVRADAATLQQVRAALATLDRPPRQLLITVGQSTGRSAREASARGSATVGSGDVQVGVNRPPAADSGAQVEVQDRQHRADIRSVSSVRALEGHETYVALGESRPFTSAATAGGGRHGPVYGQTTQHREVQTGFLATPRVSGDRVTLEISPTQQQLGSGPRPAAVATQTLTTMVTGRLGEWIELGGVEGTRQGGTTGLGTWGTRAELTQYAAWVKVEELR